MRKNHSTSQKIEPCPHTDRDTLPQPTETTGSEEYSIGSPLPRRREGRSERTINNTGLANLSSQREIAKLLLCYLQTKFLTHLPPQSNRRILYVVVNAVVISLLCSFLLQWDIRPILWNGQGNIWWRHFTFSEI